MKLQNILVNYCENEKRKSLYYNGSGSVENAEGRICLQEGATLSFGTFFNGFSLGKWRKYTETSEYYVSFQGSGKVKLSLYHSCLKEKRPVTELLLEREVELKEDQGSRLVIPENLTQGICYPVIKALSDGVVVSEGAYYGTCHKEKLPEIFLALDICTFKREPYVKRNMAQLGCELLENSQSMVYKNAQVYISDNADTLGNTFEGISYITVMPNENVGGVGGFTRGMIEAMKNPKVTHVLVMDDDAVIEPSAIEKTYVFLQVLKEEYEDYTIGGSLLRENTPWIQYESGAVWKRGKIKALHHNKDMGQLKNLLENEQEETVEYAGWWYSCIPVKRIRQCGLPLPIFIHRDDIEYGLRSGQEQFIFLNGVSVWHEAFENKMPGATEYYDWRNLAIVNSIHYKDYTKEELFLFLLKWVTANVIRYRYRYVEMNLRGIEDFLKGIDWLKEQDGQELHQEIIKMNYKAKPAKEYVGYRGLTEQELQWDTIEKVEGKKVTKARKLLQQCTLNGYLLPAKRGKVLVAMPHDNIYAMFRRKEILYVDSTGNAFLLGRSRKAALSCYRKLWKIKKLIDKEFDVRKQEYADRYQELTEEAFWHKYLKMDR